uniref:effector-associated constant component EACC1 n=1 Tax=Streptomyces sp. NBC_00998 TaxID=2903712 RepID=UPI002F911E54
MGADGPDGADQLRSLHEWLTDIDELRGRVRSRESPPRPGTLGPVLDALVVALGPAGAATAFTTAVIAWLRTRPGEVRIKVTLPNRKSVELTAKNVSDLDATSLEQQVSRVIGLLSEGGDGAARREDS